MLDIRNLHVDAHDKPILKGLNLQVKAGEVHAIMGPNGSGKSTLSNVITGKPEYIIQSGQLYYLGEDVSEASPDVRCQQGIFMAFQYPVSIPGVSNVSFLKAAYNAQMSARGERPLDAIEFLSHVRKLTKQVGLSEDFLHRAINDGFSGGEKKRNEVLQMLLFSPKLVLLDETDSGLDVDALQILADGVNQLRDDNRSFIIVTHYQRLLEMIKPDHVHVLSNGQIIQSGDMRLASEIEAKGYTHLMTESTHA